MLPLPNNEEDNVEAKREESLNRKLGDTSSVVTNLLSYAVVPWF